MLFLFSLNTSPVSQRSSNYLKPLQPLRVTALSRAENSLYTTQHTIPLTQAPGTPPTSSKRKLLCMKPDLSKTNSTPTTTAYHTCKSKVDTLSVISDPIYQTIDHYETVNF